MMRHYNNYGTQKHNKMRMPLFHGQWKPVPMIYVYKMRKLVICDAATTTLFRIVSLKMETMVPEHFNATQGRLH